MKTVITVVIVGVLLNALVRTGVVAWKYFQLKDEAQQIVLFGGKAPAAELSRQIVRTAGELQVPLEPQDVSVSRNGARTTAEVFYTQPIELFPNYVYPVDLSFFVETFSLDTSGPGSITGN